MSARDVSWTWLLAFVASVAVGTRGIAYWDAGDYVRLALEGGVSGLLLGRPLFLWISRALVSPLFHVGVDPSSAEPVLRFFWTAVSATAAPLLGLLGVALGLSRRAALAAAVALALSPSFAHTAHQVLTDGPALALSLAALLAAARGRAILAGLILACAIATRETSAVHAVALVLLLRRRALVALLATTVASIAIVLAAHGGPAALGGWVGSMRRSSGAHPLSTRDVLVSLAWIVAAGPVPIVVGLAHLRHVQAAAPVRAAYVIVPAALVTFALVLYPDGSFSPRYVLATAPLLFLAAGDTLAKRPLASALALFLPLALVPLATRRTRAIAERGRAIEARLAELSRNGVAEPLLLVPGHYCPHARLALAIERRRSGTLRDVAMLCPGWDWPEHPARALDEAGRTVALDVADDAWVGPRELAPREAVRAWATSHQGRERASTSVAGFVVIRP